MVKFYWQERVWTCGPAALRIALANIGIEKDEKYFTKLLRTTLSRGTSNKNFIKAVKKLNVKSRFTDELEDDAVDERRYRQICPCAYLLSPSFNKIGDSIQLQMFRLSKIPRYVNNYFRRFP